MKSRLALLLVTLLANFHPVPTAAQWQLDGTPIVTVDLSQYAVSIVSDGDGGAVMAWADFRSDLFAKIFVQRVDAAGIIQWALDGDSVCTAASEQLGPAITSDGAGGAIVAWHDYRSGANYDIYAQRIDATGALQWDPDGVVLCATMSHALDVVIVSDGAGGAIVAWADSRGGPSYDVYAQRVNAAGAPQWTNNGVALCTAASHQTFLSIVSDGASGAIVAWTDYRSGTNTDIYARRINAAGVAQWTANGVVVCNATNDQESARIVSDGAGGAIVTWQDYRSTTNFDIYAQRVIAAGTVQWTANGVALCALTSDQASPVIASDGAAGAIACWSDFRNGMDGDAYAQRINANGTVQWTANGAALAANPGDQYVTAMIDDGAGGAILAWDNVGGDLRAQRTNAMGAIQWPADGVPICMASGDQYDTRLISDGSGGAIAAWTDLRSGDEDVYATRIDSDGTIPTAVGRDTPAAFTLGSPYPNPFSTAATMELELSSPANVMVDVYDVAGRRVATRSLGELNEGWQTIRVVADDDDGRALPSGVYFVAIEAAGSRVTRKMVIVR